VPKLKRLGGAQVVAIVRRHGFRVVKTRGSHVKLKREMASAPAQTLTIPLHAELATGTLLAIYRQCCRYIAEEQLHADFYSE
jgi:predicted RNA binding protein YcfA (HicA-like mRNA interferase family)